LKLSELENVSKFMMNLVRARIDSVRIPNTNTETPQRKNTYVSPAMYRTVPSQGALLLFSIRMCPKSES